LSTTDFIDNSAIIRRRRVSSCIASNSASHIAPTENHTFVLMVRA